VSAADARRITLLDAIRESPDEARWLAVTA
jgi:hypothetical protein